MNDDPSYLAGILDVRTRKVVRYAISRNIDTTLILARCGLQYAPQPLAGRVFHTDRQAQYASEYSG